MAIRPPEASETVQAVSWPRGVTDCHTSDIGHWFAMTGGKLVYSGQDSDKSFHFGFMLSIRAFLRFRFQLFICFSLVMAA